MKNFLLGVMATVLAIVLLGANYPQEKEKTVFEYANPRITDIEQDLSRQEVLGGRTEQEKRVLTFVNKQGAAGWKLVHIQEQGVRASHLWFEREK